MSHRAADEESKRDCSELMAGQPTTGKGSMAASAKCASRPVSTAASVNERLVMAGADGAREAAAATSPSDAPGEVDADDDIDDELTSSEVTAKTARQRSDTSEARSAETVAIDCVSAGGAVADEAPRADEGSAPDVARAPPERGSGAAVA